MSNDIDVKDNYIGRRGIAVGITEARELYEKQFEMFGENPYFKYTLFLLKIASIKSK